MFIIIIIIITINIIIIQWINEDLFPKNSKHHTVCTIYCFHHTVPGSVQCPCRKETVYNELFSTEDHSHISSLKFTLVITSNLQNKSLTSRSVYLTCTLVVPCVHNTYLVNTYGHVSHLNERHGLTDSHTSINTRPHSSLTEREVVAAHVVCLCGWVCLCALDDVFVCLFVS